MGHGNGNGNGAKWAGNGKCSVITVRGRVFRRSSHRKQTFEDSHGMGEGDGLTGAKILNDLEVCRNEDSCEVEKSSDDLRNMEDSYVF